MNLNELKKDLMSIVNGECQSKNRMSFLRKEYNKNVLVDVEEDVIIIKDIVFDLNFEKHSDELESSCSELILKLSRLNDDYYRNNIIIELKDISGNKYNCISYVDKNLIVEINDKFLGELWSDFSNVPVDETGEYIDNDFFIWKKGHEKMDIWKWFDKYHSVGLAKGLMKLD